jgi:NAD(P)-dependent dehydrogenase (short-subunit alcohol dehydrogenase family)
MHTMLLRRLALLVCSLILLAPCAHAADAAPVKAILITGASTGIGRNLTEHLAAAGYFVYAGARKPADLEALGKIANVQAVALDVTKPDQIAAAVDTITKAGRGLYALVNNAGVGSVGTATGIKPEEFDLIMQVNVYGPYRVTRAFAPLIIASKGRITTISSVAGIGAPAPVSAYSMSKHAIEAFGDTLAGEMEPQGVKVSLIEPGNYNSDLGKSALARTGIAGRLTDRSMYKPPDEVSAAVALALFEEHPKRRYLVAPTQDEADRTLRKQIAQLVELNEGQAYTLDRDALIKMLDEALATARPKIAAESPTR